jgi:hypothetical protein
LFWRSCCIFLRIRRRGVNLCLSKEADSHRKDAWEGGRLKMRRLKVYRNHLGWCEWEGKASCLDEARRERGVMGLGNGRGRKTTWSFFYKDKMS